MPPETHTTLGLRPAPYPPLFDQAGILVGLEGDLGAATALFILNRLAGSACLFTEFWFWDESENIVVGGHAGNTVTAGVLGASIGGGGSQVSANRVTDHLGTRRPPRC